MSEVKAAPARGANLFKIGYNDLVVCDNVREDMGDIKSLAASILELANEKEDPTLCEGIRTPLRVRYNKGTQQYEIISGHRRYEAMKHLIEMGNAPLDEVRLPCIKESVSFSELDRVLSFMRDNGGKPLNILEEAEVCRRLRDDFGMKNKEIAPKISKSVTHVRNCLLLMDEATTGLKNKIRKGQIAPSLVIEELLAKRKGEDLDEELEEQLGEESGGETEHDNDLTPKKVTRKNLSAKSADKQVAIAFFEDLYKKIDKSCGDDVNPYAMATLKALPAYCRNEMSYEELLAVFQS